MHCYIASSVHSETLGLAVIVSDHLLSDASDAEPLHNFVTDSSVSPRKRRIFTKSALAALVLWPDGSVFKEEVPNCVKHARYIYTSYEAQSTLRQERALC